MEVEVSHSNVEWVLVRPPILSDADPTGSVHIVPDGETAHKITRADLAQFLVDQLTTDAYLRRAVTVANSYTLSLQNTFPQDASSLSSHLRQSPAWPSGVASASEKASLARGAKGGNLGLPHNSV